MKRILLHQSSRILFDGLLPSVATLLLATSCAATSAHAQPAKELEKRAHSSPTQQLRPQKLPPGLTDAKASAHVIAPARLKNIQIEEHDSSKITRLEIPAIVKQFTTTPKLDVGAFGLALHNVLKDSVAGYILQIRQNGVPIHLGVWNWAQTPADQSQGWNDKTRMHLASVSKFLTAVGLVKTLSAARISYDAKIVGYLPTYWAKGNNVDKITFRHLLTHTSGLVTGSSDSDYALMKSKIAAGIANVGTGVYENMNFGLMRILIPIVNGQVDKDTFFTSEVTLNDAYWDLLTLHFYKKYMQDNVFTPAGVANADFSPPAGSNKAFAYRFPPGNVSGWNSGDLSTVAGGAGWRLSTSELLSVMHHVRRKNTIISSDKTQYMFNNLFGFNGAPTTAAGTMYYKAGMWRNFCESTGCKTEQCGAYFLPGGLELVVFVNSPIGAAGYNLWQIVLDTYNNSLSN